MESEQGAARSRTRAAILTVAARLLADGGAAALTTRAVAAAAGVQAPTIYRVFGDKEGLLDAVAEHAFAAYVEGKVLAEQTEDPVADLDLGWETHVGFGLANPALFALLSDPARGARLASAERGTDILSDRVHRVAAAGRLGVPEPRAVDIIRAAGTGVVLTLLSATPAQRDTGLVAALWAAVKRAILVAAPELPAARLGTAAVTLRAQLTDVTSLSASEQRLLADWLDRIAADEGARPSQ